MGVLVAEASIKSGSLISAVYAVQQTRCVCFAWPFVRINRSEGWAIASSTRCTLVFVMSTHILEECYCTSLDTLKIRVAQNKAAERTVVHGKNVAFTDHFIKYLSQHLKAQKR